MTEGSSVTRISYSREELLRLRYPVITPPDVPDEIRRSRYGRSRETWMPIMDFHNRTTGSSPDQATRQNHNKWMPSRGQKGPMPRQEVSEGAEVKKQQESIKVHGMEGRKIIHSFSEDVELHKSSNPWRPRKVKVEHDPEEKVTEDLLRKVRSILNKLTPEKFEKLMQQVTDLPLNTEARLEGIAEMIVEKALHEAKFASTYAKMCDCLKELTVPCNDPAFFLNFRLLILSLCRKEFWKITGEGVALEKRWKALNNAGMDAGQHLKEELEAKVIAHRRRAVGSMKFLGELFKLEMVKNKVVHGCISTLLDTRTEEALECLCCLISTTGAVVDSENVKPQMDGYFNKMEDILKEGKTTSRVGFLMQDVFELRQNNWLTRRAEQGPETINRVHRAAELEQQLVSRTYLPPGRLDRSPWASNG